jgi:TolB-like protein/Tfp pilus assembly protein PilF
MINEMDAGAIQSQLSRMLEAEVFQNSLTLSRFLQFIVKETLAGHETQLKEYTIALKLYAKKPDFNPQVDPIIRINAWRLRRTLNHYYLQDGKNDDIIISIPKGAYIPIFKKRDHQPDEPAFSENTEPFSRKGISVAVLPFINNSEDAGTVAFADALADHISTELTRYSELSVISYYSCRNIISRVSDVKEAGLLLDARYILTGTVQSDSRRLRIRVQLILAETREQVWANSYEKISTTDRLFEVQDEIAWKVVSQTAGHYGAISRNVAKLPPQKSINDLEVYNAIFWYYHFVGDVSAEMFYKAEQVLCKAVEKEPAYALGWAVLGEVWVGGYFMGYKSRITEDQLDQAVKVGRKSLRIDPNCQHAYQTIALANIFLKRKEESLKVIEEWLKIKPGEAGIQGGMGFILICCGEYERGYKLLDDSVQLNPYYQWWFNAGFSFYYFHHNDFTHSFYWAEKMNMPIVPWELLLKIACSFEMNLMAAAEKYCIQLKREFPMIPAMLDEYVHAVLRDPILEEKLKSALKRAFSRYLEFIQF